MIIRKGHGDNMGSITLLLETDNPFEITWC